MTFPQLPAGAAVFVDANVLVYHFTNDPAYGAACTQLVKRIELQQFQGFTSAHVLADVAHRLMTVEAIQRLGWAQAGVAARLRKHHVEIPRLTVFRQAIVAVPHLGLQCLPITQPLIDAATQVSQQYELLTGDALVVAVMQAQGLTNVASNDADFDRVAGLTRYAPA